VELELDFAIKIDAEGVILAVTHRVSRPFRQGAAKTLGFLGKGANAVPESTSRLGNLGL
jgi:hypothetical protein